MEKEAGIRKQGLLDPYQRFAKTGGVVIFQSPDNIEHVIDSSIIFIPFLDNQTGTEKASQGNTTDNKLSSLSGTSSLKRSWPWQDFGIKRILHSLAREEINSIDYSDLTKSLGIRRSRHNRIAKRSKQIFAIHYMDAHHRVTSGRPRIIGYDQHIEILSKGLSSSASHPAIDDYLSQKSGTADSRTQWRNVESTIGNLFKSRMNIAILRTMLYVQLFGQVGIPGPLFSTHITLPKNILSATPLALEVAALMVGKRGRSESSRTYAGRVATFFQHSPASATVQLDFKLTGDMFFNKASLGFRHPDAAHYGAEQDQYDHMISVVTALTDLQHEKFNYAPKNRPDFRLNYLNGFNASPRVSIQLGEGRIRTVNPLKHS